MIPEGRVILIVDNVPDVSSVTEFVVAGPDAPLKYCQEPDSPAVLAPPD